MVVGWRGWRERMKATEEGWRHMLIARVRLDDMSEEFGASGTRQNWLVLYER